MESKRSRVIRKTQLEDVPELIHQIMSLLPPKEAGRTCVLSKSWLQAWSTIPTLRFTHPPPEFIYRTLQRYHRFNIPIESFNINLRYYNRELEEWIRVVASKSCLKHLSLVISAYTFPNLPDEIFSGENLESIYVRAPCCNPIRIRNHPVINCVSLRVLKLKKVTICQEVFANVLSTCHLLEKISLYNCLGLKTIKVKNLRYLRELKIRWLREQKENVLEIENVPSLGLFRYCSKIVNPLLAFNTCYASLASVKVLHIRNVTIDPSFFDIIKSGFPFLESLNVCIHSWEQHDMVITSASLNKLYIIFSPKRTPIGIQVYAPNLKYLSYEGSVTIPTFSFPNIDPEKIKLTINLGYRINDPCCFFSKMRDVLNFSSQFDIDFIEASPMSFDDTNIDVDDLIRRRVSIPATNVQQLSFTTTLDDNVCEHTRFFGAFFSICCPNYVKADNKCFTELLVRWVMENKTTYLKDAQWKNKRNGKWEAITTSWASVLDTLDTAPYDVEFKLSWFQH